MDSSKTKDVGNDLHVERTNLNKMWFNHKGVNRMCQRLVKAMLTPPRKKEITYFTVSVILSMFNINISKKNYI